MPNFDDLLTRELERAGRPAAPDPQRVVEEITRRRARRGIIRRVQAGTLTVVVLAVTVTGFVALSRTFRAPETPGNVAPSPSTPTAAASPSSEPEPSGRDIGLGFPVCNVSRARGDFDGDGQIDTAFHATRLSDTGPCDPSDAFNVVAVDLDADGLADASYGPLEVPCDIGCEAFDATDLDGDGSNELIIKSYFSIMDYYFFALRQDGADAPRLEPILVADPGHRPAGIEPGEPLRIDAGGDEGYASSIMCEGYALPVLWWHWQLAPIEGGGPREHHVTRIRLEADGLFHVIDANDYEVPAGQADPLLHVNRGNCGVDWHLS